MHTRPTTWAGMKEIMRRRFVPEHYKRDMHNKLQQLTQGNKSVDAYYKEMELLMIRTGTREDPEATMSRFFYGLNIEVQDRVEMVLYYNIQDLVHQAERAEQQIKRRQVTAPPPTWRRSHTEVAGSSAQPTPSRSNNISLEAPKSGVSTAASSRSSANIECFTCGGRGHMRRDCPNKKRVLLTQDGYVSASDDDKVADSSREGSEEVEAVDAYPSDAPLICTNLMVQRVTADRIEDSGQRWSIFQTQCTVKDTACKLIIDGGSYTNIVSKGLVDSLSLPTWKHPQPHCVEWLYNSGKLKVTHKVRLKFSVGTYEDTVICDVLPMDACHLLLGRPWQFDRRSTHEGRSNVYSLWHKGKRHVLQPMLDKDIKVEAFAATKKGHKLKAKPRTVSIQAGGDDEGRISITPAILPPPYILKVGLFCIAIPPTDEVKPNFRTPPTPCELAPKA